MKEWTTRPPHKAGVYHFKVSDLDGGRMKEVWEQEGELYSVAAGKISPLRDIVGYWLLDK